MKNVGMTDIFLDPRFIYGHEHFNILQSWSSIASSFSVGRAPYRVAIATSPASGGKDPLPLGHAPHHWVAGWRRDLPGKKEGPDHFANITQEVTSCHWCLGGTLVFWEKFSGRNCFYQRTFVQIPQCCSNVTGWWCHILCDDLGLPLDKSLPIPPSCKVGHGNLSSIAKGKHAWSCCCFH